MPEYIGHNETGGEKVLRYLALAAFVLLMVVIAQPAWRGEEMLVEMRTNCGKVGGVMLESKRMFGTSYSCAERKD